MVLECPPLRASFGVPPAQYSPNDLLPPLLVVEPVPEPKKVVAPPPMIIDLTVTRNEEMALLPDLPMLRNPEQAVARSGADLKLACSDEIASGSDLGQVIAQKWGDMSSLSQEELDAVVSRQEARRRTARAQSEPEVAAEQAVLEADPLYGYGWVSTKMKRGGNGLNQYGNLSLAHRTHDRVLQTGAERNKHNDSEFFRLARGVPSLSHTPQWMKDTFRTVDYNANVVQAVKDTDWSPPSALLAQMKEEVAADMQNNEEASDDGIAGIDDNIVAPNESTAEQVLPSDEELNMAIRRRRFEWADDPEVSETERDRTYPWRINPPTGVVLQRIDFAQLDRVN